MVVVASLAAASLAAVVPADAQPADPTEREPVQYWCSWSPHAPRLARLLVDLRLVSGDANRLPAPTDLAAVTARGGVVRYQFQVAVVRAVLDTGAIRALLSGPTAIAQSATAVVDPTRHDVQVQIFFDRATTVEDERAVRAAGGQNVARIPHLVLNALLPDSAVAAVARLPAVRSVRAQSLGCAWTGSGSAPSSHQLARAGR